MFFAALLALPLQAQAQTTFVSNLLKTSDDTYSRVTNEVLVAQQFTTGNFIGGYELAEIVVNTSEVTGETAFALHSSTRNLPGGKLVALVRDTTDPKKFTPEAPQNLSHTTKYFIVFAMKLVDYEASLQRTTSSGVDPGASTGWGIGNTLSSNEPGSWNSNPHDFSIKIAIKGQEINVAPAFDGESTTRSVPENRPAGTDVGLPVTAGDANTGAELTYSLGGDDAASFNIDEGTGQITTKSTYDYENDRLIYSVTVMATDGREGTGTIAVEIEVTNVAELPGKPDRPIVKATPRRTTSLDVAWEAPGNEGKPPIESYQLQYKEKSDNDSDENWTDGPPVDVMDGTSASIESLDAETSYDVRVLATNEDGNGPWSDKGTGSTNLSPVFSDGESTTRSVPENRPCGHERRGPCDRRRRRRRPRRPRRHADLYAGEGHGGHGRLEVLLDRLDLRADHDQVDLRLRERQVELLRHRQGY